MRQTKILMALMAMEIGGAETHVLELCKALQKRGLKVYVASNGGAYESELAACGVVHYKVPLHNKQLYNIGGAYRALKKIITENDIRLVHAHARIPAFLCGFLQKRLGFRFVTTAHWVFSTKFPYNILSNWGEKSLAVSEDIKQYLMRSYQVPEENIYTTINGVDTDKFKPRCGLVGDAPLGVPGIPGIPRDAQGQTYTFAPYETYMPETCIMSISRLDKDRSLAAHLLIEAAPVLYERVPNIVIYIIGGGNDYDAINAKANAANNKLGAEVIRLTGPRTDIHKWLTRADIFVGASRAVLEAMATGVPVVASGNEGYMGLLSEDKLPLAIETNFCYRGCGEADAGQLTDALLTLLDASSEEREKMGAWGREFVKANYSVERMADDALKLYNAVLVSPYPAVRARKTDVMISGYYGYNNSGDDLLLQSIVTDLKAHRPDLLITVLSMRPKETRRQYGVNAIYRFNLFAIRRMLKRTRLLITGGGSVIQDLTSTQSLVYYLWIIKTAHHMGVKNMLYANGIGPIGNTANIKRVKNTLNKVELITLREEASKKLLQELGVAKPTMHVTADAAFTLAPPSTDASAAALASLGIEPGKFICVAVRAWRGNPEGFEAELAAFADYMAREYGFKVLFTPMRPSEDTEISQKIINLMTENASLLPPMDDIDTIRGVVGLSAITIAMRLHTLIYAINQGVPAIGLVYDPKVEWLMQSSDQPYYVPVEETTYDTLQGFADAIMSDREAAAAVAAAAGERAKKLAQRNVELCVGLL